MTAAELKKWMDKAANADSPDILAATGVRIRCEAMMVALEEAQGMICHNRACPHRLCEASDIRAVTELKEKP